MTMERKSISLLGPKKPNTMLLMMFSLCMPSKMHTKLVSSLLNSKNILVRVIGETLSAKSDVNGLSYDMIYYCKKNLQRREWSFNDLGTLMYCLIPHCARSPETRRRLRSTGLCGVLNSSATG